MQVIPFEIYEDLELLEPKTKTVIIKLIKFLGETVRREDFLELKAEIEKLTKTVAELAEAQKRTDQRLAELAEAQKRTDQRLAELAEAQKRTEEELKSLSKTVSELSNTVSELSNTVSELSKTVAELTVSHKKLVEDHMVTRAQLGGLAHTVGYFLENEAYKHLPRILKRDFNLEVEGRLYRDYVEIGPKKYEEINILGRGRINGEVVVILGEVKTQLKKKDVDQVLKKVQKLEKVYKERKIVLAVTHQTPPQVREYAREKGVKIYFSYEFD